MVERVNTVFILGAGASKQAGVPLMTEFIDVARNLWRMGNVGERGHDFDIVFEALSRLQVVHSKSQFDLQNIENVFSAFEFARVLKTFCGYDQARIQELSKAAKGVIAHTVEETLRFPRGSDGPNVPQPYGEFADLLYDLRRAPMRHDLSLHTFNYDFAMDFALRGVSNVNYGFSGRKEHADEIALLKLHGSINWVVCGQCGAIVPVSLDDFANNMRRVDYASLTRLNFSRSLRVVSHCHVRVDPEPFLAPPTWNKTAYHEKLSAIWSLASASLAVADNIIVIGYSLPETDIFFRHLYALGTIGGHLLERFWVFNPDKTGAVKSRFTALLGPGAQQRFQYFEQNFAESIITLTREFES